MQFMDKEGTIAQFKSSGAIAVVRMDARRRVEPVVAALHSGGIRCIEITMTVPGASSIIEALVKNGPDDVIVGAGTVIRIEDAESVIDAGARFVVAPNFNLEVVKLCNERGIAVAPGCFSPTEIVTAWDAGADLIKVFPANTLGPGYFGSVGGPLPDIPLMPTGGVTVDNAGTWIKAGAIAVAVGSDLLDKEAISRGAYGVLERRAARLIENIRNARGHIKAPVSITDGKAT